MSTTTLQVPVEASLKSKATKVARDMGFSSLQETVRIFLTKLAGGGIRVSLDTIDADEYVSPKTLARYDKIERDICMAVNLLFASTFRKHFAKCVVSSPSLGSHNQVYA